MSAHGFVNVVNEQGHTEIVRYDAFVAGLFKMDLTSPNKETLNKLHAAVGVSGEAGELLDAIKKVWIYNKPLEERVEANILEELGDLRFYMQALQNLMGFSDQDVLQANANKLAVRYKSLTYSDAAAQERADKAPGE